MMNANEEAALKAVMGKRLRYIDAGPHSPCIYDTLTENVTPVADCPTAADAISQLLHDALVMGRYQGVVQAQKAVQEALEMPANMAMGGEGATTTNDNATS